jgi:hypothetical protein
MTYGFKAINDSDFIQIDEDTVSFQILATGSTSSGYGQYVTIPNSYPEDIFVVIRPNSPSSTSAYVMRGYMFDYTPSGGDRIRRAYMGSSVNTTFPAFNGASDYAIVERADGSGFTVPTSGYGLNVYKSNGDLSFSSEIPNYRVAATRNYNISASNSGDGIWYTPPSGKSVLGMYTFLSSFDRYRSKQYSLGGSERGNLDYYRHALFDYPNNRFGLDIKSYYSDGPSGGSIYDYVWSGYRTEMIGDVT